MTREAPLARDFTRLPEPTPVTEMIETQAASDALAPDMGHDSEHEWMLRFAAG